MNPENTAAEDLLSRAFEKIDAANAADPNMESTSEGSRPRELVYGRRMSAWLKRLYPEASEALRVAARAQHIRRWEIPRKDYPEGKAGYYKWRTTLYGFHADAAAEIMESVGYDPATIERVRFLLHKKDLKKDPETQALEDVICLVFLEYYFEGFSGDYSPEKVIDILRKTWKKMSEHGQAAALKLDMPEAAASLVQRALAPDS